MYNRAKIKQDLQIMTGDTTNDDVIDIIINRADSYILSKITDSYVPQTLAYVVLEIALVLYNRVGNEGMTSQSISSINNSYDQNVIPPYIDQMIADYSFSKDSSSVQPRIKGLRKR